jgi:hypothetical protein
MGMRLGGAKHNRICRKHSTAIKNVFNTIYHHAETPLERGAASWPDEFLQGRYKVS